jgi:hypothetical protein
VPPSDSISARVRSRPSTDRAVIATVAPSAASRMAATVPVPPWLAPVTSATRPFAAFPMAFPSLEVRHFTACLALT